MHDPCLVVFGRYRFGNNFSFVTEHFVIFSRKIRKKILTNLCLSYLGDKSSLGIARSLTSKELRASCVCMCLCVWSVCVYNIVNGLGKRVNI